MPLDSLLLSIAVCIVFLAFAGVLAWADYSTSNGRSAKPSDEMPSDKPKAAIRKNAA